MVKDYNPGHMESIIANKGPENEEELKSFTIN